MSTAARRIDDDHDDPIYYDLERQTAVVFVYLTLQEQ